MVCHGASMETNGATRNHVWTTSEPRPLQVSSQLSPLPFPRPHLQPETLSNCQAILIDVNVHSQISQQLKETEMSWDVLRSMNWISRVPDHRHVSQNSSILLQLQRQLLSALRVSSCTSLVTSRFVLQRFEFRVGPPAPPWPTAVDLLWTWKNKTDQTINLLNDKFVKTC